MVVVQNHAIRVNFVVDCNLSLRCNIRMMMYFQTSLPAVIQTTDFCHRVKTNQRTMRFLLHIFAGVCNSLQPIYPGDVTCWTPGFDWNSCCHPRHGPFGNQPCWISGDIFGEYTHDRCCFPKENRVIVNESKATGFDAPCPPMDIDLTCAAHQAHYCRSVDSSIPDRVFRTKRNIMQSYQTNVKFQIHAGELFDVHYAYHNDFRHETVRTWTLWRYLLRYLRVVDRIQCLSCFEPCFHGKLSFDNALAEACDLMNHAVGPLSHYVPPSILSVCHGSSSNISIQHDQLSIDFMDEVIQVVSSIFDQSLPAYIGNSVEWETLTSPFGQPFGLSKIADDLSLGEICTHADWMSTHLGAVVDQPKGQHPWNSWLHFSITPYAALITLQNNGVELSWHVVNLGTETGNCNEGRGNHDHANCMLNIASTHRWNRWREQSRANHTFGRRPCWKSRKRKTSYREASWRRRAQ